MRLSPHQKRVLAALAALELRYDWRWWSRAAIGCVVAAGGYHATIQRATMAALKRIGLVQTERSSWPAEMQSLVRCNCGCCAWGLTEVGDRMAALLRVAQTPELEKHLEMAWYYDVPRRWLG